MTKLFFNFNLPLYYETTVANVYRMVNGRKE